MSRPGPTPFPFRALEREFFRMLKDAFQAPETGDAGDGPKADADAPFTPAADVYETPEETVLVVELPGVDPSQVEITAEGDVLTIRGVKPADDPAGSPRGPRERAAGPFAQRTATHLTPSRRTGWCSAWPGPRSRSAAPARG